jgi:hypothetical protein
MTAFRLSVACLAIANLFAALGFLYLGLEYHIGEGYGLVGFISFPAALGMTLLCGKSLQLFVEAQ